LTKNQEKNKQITKMPKTKKKQTKTANVKKEH